MVVEADSRWVIAQDDLKSAAAMALLNFFGVQEDCAP